MILNYHYSFNKNSQGSRPGIRTNAWASLCLYTQASAKTLGIYIPIRFMMASLKHGKDNMALARQTFIMFCNHFEKLPRHDLENDPKVIKFFSDNITKDNTLCNKAFQLALDVAYSKRHFTRNSILKQFEKYISFQNPLDRYDTSSSIDQSTYFSALQCKILHRYHPEWNIVVHETPPSNISVQNLSPVIQNTLEENKILTGNRFPDTSINDISFDFKATKDISLTKNHIYMINDLDNAKEFVSKSLYKLLEYSIKENRKKLSTEYYNKLKIKLETTVEELKKSSNWKSTREIIDSWNDFYITTKSARPRNFGMPIFQLIEKPNTTEKIHLPENTGKVYLPENINNVCGFENPLEICIPEGNFDQLKTRQVLETVISKYPKDLQDNVYKATRGSLGHILDSLEKNV